jgi:hypothetical protein
VEVNDDPGTDRERHPAMIQARGLLGGHPHYLHWGVVQISLTNFLIILLMIIIFVLALVLPFPHPRSEARASEDHDGHS